MSTDQNQQHTELVPYSDESFWDKVKKFSKKAGAKVVYAALLLFYCLKSDACPAWAKATIIGSLAYFISPLDAIPDFIVGVGFSDDMGALITAIGVCAKYIDENVKANAKSKLAEWFGPESEEDVRDIDRLLPGSK